jgi:hypothetical protein
MNLSVPLVAHVVEEAADVRIKHPVHLLPLQPCYKRIERLMGLRAGRNP